MQFACLSIYLSVPDDTTRVVKFWGRTLEEAICIYGRERHSDEARESDPS